MVTIARSTVDVSGVAPWDAVAQRIREWTAEHNIALRDAIVLVPFLQLLAPARRSFATGGGWMPRVETTRTLAEALGPPPLRGSGEAGWGVAHDTVLAMQALARQPWGADWRQRDPWGFARAAARVVDAAHELISAAAALAPNERELWWSSARDALRSGAGPGQRERLLAHVALEWAARSVASDTDRLFALRPAAWVVVAAGGADPLADALLARGVAPSLRIETDVDPSRPFAEAALREAPAFRLCDGFEDEAEAAAAQALAHVERGETPVALIAQDRALIRRIRALLERGGVVLRDETGWKLATTRAGAAIMATLRSARRDAAADTWLDWLKSTALGKRHSAALEALEAAARKAQVSDVAGLDRLALDAGPAGLRAEAQAIATLLARPARRPIVDWLDALAAALERTGALADLLDDAAGREALAALGLSPALEAARRAQLAVDLEPMSLAEFTSWVDELLESETFRPPDPVDADAHPLPAEVVITPMARAMLRPFAAVVLPGADDRLGAAAPPDALLPREVRRTLGLADSESRRRDELFAFAQLLRLPRLTLLRRRADGPRPLGDSPLVEALSLALAERGTRLVDAPEVRIERTVAPAPIEPGAPSVPASRLPRRLSASTFEALRDCPYRFFAQSVLGLRAVDELDPEVEKRDYGKWLHEVLYAFHVGREPGAGAAADSARLHAVAAATREAHGLDETAFLPFSASFEVLVPRYVAWLHDREAKGDRWQRGEIDLVAAPAALEGVELHGRVDRIDRVDAGEALELIDYKTGSSSQLKKTVADRFEDTQLAFYAALVGAESPLPLRASYLALDATKKLDQHLHVDVAASADALVAGIAEDLRRLRAGAGMAPLGEGSACTYCEARGLCRRDHWTRPAEPELGAEAAANDAVMEDDAP